jgi:hypothetical protein
MPVLSFGVVAQVMLHPGRSDYQGYTPGDLECCIKGETKFRSEYSKDGAVLEFETSKGLGAMSTTAKSHCVQALPGFTFDHFAGANPSMVVHLLEVWSMAGRIDQGGLLVHSALN